MPTMTKTDTKAKASKGSKKPVSTATLDPSQPSESWADFFKGVGQEFHKIAWPTMPQIWGNTVIVILMTAIVSTGMWGMDNVFRTVIWVLTEVIPNQVG